jgi:predicted metal-dependent peptidase
MNESERKIRAARGKITYLRPYFSHAAFALVLVESKGCPSLSVDKWKRLYYNPRAVEEMTVDELATVLLHEMGHCLCEHHRRADALGVTSRTFRIANVAQDAELNDNIRDEINKRNDLPHLPPPRWNPKAMALPEKLRGPIYPWKINCEDNRLWEEYYISLMEQATSQPTKLEVILCGKGGSDPMDSSDNCGSGAHGVAQPWEVGDPGDSEVEGVFDADWRDVKRLTAEAIAERQRGRGDVPGGWVEWAQNLLRPKAIPWDQVLGGTLRWAINDVKGHQFHSYKRPSRRASVMDGVVLPTMRKPQPFVCVVGDTSASMGTKVELALVRGTVEDICQSMGAMVAFLATDTEVHGGVQKVQSGRRVELRGRGGTNMCAGIEYAMSRLRPKPDVIVVTTDCATAWPVKSPGVRVVICAISATEADIANCPFWATVIQVEPKVKS